MNETIEELDIDLEDFTEVIKRIGLFSRYSFPVITISKHGCFFNNAAAKYVPECFKWYVSDDWCVLAPCDKNEKASYKRITSNHNGKEYFRCRFPSELSGSTLMHGIHKLYKTKDGGVAFKRYELLDA